MNCLLNGLPRMYTRKSIPVVGTREYGAISRIPCELRRSVAGSVERLEESVKSVNNR